jgi:hypothetical protein
MKTTLLVIFLFSFTAHCYAQVDPQKMLYLQKAEKYRKMKNTGTVLTVAGGILFVTGLVTLVNASTNNTSSQTTAGDVRNGFYAYVGGAAALGSGIPLWIVGSYKQEKYEAKAQNLSVRINANPQNKGLTLIYRF